MEEHSSPSVSYLSILTDSIKSIVLLWTWNVRLGWNMITQAEDALFEGNAASWVWLQLPNYSQLLWSQLCDNPGAACVFPAYHKQKCKLKNLPSNQSIRDVLKFCKRIWRCQFLAQEISKKNYDLLQNQSNLQIPIQISPY